MAFIGLTSGVLVISVWFAFASLKIYNDHSKFYGRSSASKYPLDVAQLRSAFLMSERLTERIHDFRQERAIALLTEQLETLTLKKGGKLVLHLLPLSAFSGSSVNRISPKKQLSTQFPPLGVSEWNHKLNIDGIVTYSQGQDRDGIAYCQLFRSGIVEAVSVIEPWDNGDLLLPSQWYELELLNVTKRYLDGLSKFEVEAPIYLALSLVGMKGYRLGVDRRFFTNREVLDRELVLLPEIVIEEHPTDLSDVYRPAFDMVWNAFGYEKSFNYDEQGKWKAQ